MDGIRNVGGTKTTQATFAGQTWTLRTQLMARYSERENYILSLKPNPLKLVERLPPLPSPPTPPIPLDPGASPEQHAAASRELATYQKAKQEHDELVSTRKRIERTAWSEAQRPQVVTFEDETAFDNSLHGIAWRLWIALRDHHPEIDSVQAAINLIERTGSKNIASIIDALSQSEERDLQGNSSAPMSGSLGASSTPASPGATAGSLATSTN